MNYESLLKDILNEDERFVVMTAENRAALRTLPVHFSSRFIDVGIAEQTLIGMSAGLALRGRIPVVHALAAFLTMRAFEFIRTDIGISELPVKLVGSIPGVLSEANGPTHQALEDIALMRGIPSMKIFCPADYEDLLIGLRTVLYDDAPFYIRFNALAPALSHDRDFAVGKAEVISEGSDVTIITYGPLFKEAYSAIGMLEEHDIHAGLVNLRTVKPFDEEAVLSAVETSRFLVVLEDHFITGGLFSAIAELFLRRHITCRVLPITMDNRWFKPARLDDILAYEGFSAQQIAERIMEELDAQYSAIQSFLS